MDDKERSQLSDRLRSLAEELGSEEVQAKIDSQVRRNTATATREHARFLTRSREFAHRRVVG